MGINAIQATMTKTKPAAQYFKALVFLSCNLATSLSIKLLYVSGFLVLVDIYHSTQKLI